MMLQYIRSVLLALIYSPLILSEIVHSSAVPVRSAIQTVQKRATCTPESAGDPAVDDVPAIQAAIQECGNGGIIVLPAGVTFAMNSQLLLKGCVNCQIQIEGTLKASDDVALWNDINPMINIEGITGATITSLTGKGVIDGNGQKSYDAFGQGQDIYRPVVMSVNGCKDVSITNFAIVQAPVAFINVGAQSNNIKFANLDLSAKSSSQYNPRNTDGFDIGSSSYISLDKIRIENQDDCVAFKPAADHVTVTNIECIGSHGLSVGSLGKYPGNNDTVTNVLVKGATIRGADKAAGIKIYPGGSEFGTALVRNVTWEDVKVDNCDYAFQAEACYNPPNKDKSYCKASPSTAEMSGIVIRNWSGTTSAKYAPLTGYVYCPLEDSHCQFKFEGWNVKSGGSSTQFNCYNVGSDGLGIDCQETVPY